MESGKFVIDKKPARLDNIVEASVRTLEIQLKEHGINLEISHGLKSLPPVNVDASRIAWVFNNKTAGYLIKPFTHQQLMIKVREILKRKGDISNEDTHR